MNILVVRQHNQIGDMLCSLSLYKAIKKKYPNSNITLVASKTNYQIPFFEINPYVDRVLIYDKSSIKTILRFYKQLRDRKYDYGFVPSTIAVSRTSHIINYLSGAKKRIGVNSIDGVKNKSAFLLNIKDNFNWKNKHQLFRNLEIAELAGLELNKNEINDIRFFFKDEEITFAKKFIKENFPETAKKIIGFHPGAGKKQNIWPTDNFFELIKKLVEKFDNYVLITCGTIDMDIVENLVQKLKLNNIKHTLLKADNSIRKISAIISLLDLYITNDTGSMHIAGFGRTKMISLFGHSNPEEWCPFYSDSYWIKSNSNKIEDISVNEVYDLALKILD
ncbi:MAG: glycosyltransferase family 9 protein [Ignavibacterium sp.]|nr:glycosyltransferase family 9 protein [Ignavibacterium sp.]MDW8376400.1 glycosyltransferase family 9 protein [Ignavibacteriales bacterium]